MTAHTKPKETHSSELTKVFTNAQFPITKHALLQHGQTHKASKDVLHVLEQCEDKEFSNLEAITKAVAAFYSKKNTPHTKDKSSHPDTAAHLGPIDIERHLKGIHFPIHKDGLLKHLKEHKAPKDVIHLLESFAEKEYQSVIEISKEYAHHHHAHTSPNAL